MWWTSALLWALSGLHVPVSRLSPIDRLDPPRPPSGNWWGLPAHLPPSMGLAFGPSWKWDKRERVVFICRLIDGMEGGRDGGKLPGHCFCIQVCLCVWNGKTSFTIPSLQKKKCNRSTLWGNIDKLVRSFVRLFSCSLVQLLNLCEFGRSFSGSFIRVTEMVSSVCR